MKRIFILLTALGIAFTAAAQHNLVDQKWYDIQKADVDKAEAIISKIFKKHVTFPNPAKGAQWFPDASLGLFMHWGIHSPIGAQPSWAMIKGYRWNGGYNSPEEYYGQAKTFNPDYHPIKYLKEAKEAGFQYAVMTARHHDGYSLWPSKYGFGVKQFIPGRDLIKEYVDACREAGLKVGLYYSPRDWMFPGDRTDAWFDVETWADSRPKVTPEEDHTNYMKFLGYVIAQLEELLTNYGKIDILWLDGMGWTGITEHYSEQIYSWIRTLQPDIVVNDRWANIVDPDNPAGTSARIGDFTTPFECIKPTYRPSEWFEHCHIWTCGGGGWGYDRTQTFRPLSWFFEEYVASRSLGGNFLPNVGPDGEGNMSDRFYARLDSLKAWRAHSGESLEGAGPTPGVELSNVPLTTRLSGKASRKGARRTRTYSLPQKGDIWYAHLLPDFTGQVSVMTSSAAGSRHSTTNRHHDPSRSNGLRPVSVTLLRTGEPVPHMFIGGAILFKLSPSDRTKTDDVVKIQF